MPTLPTKFHDLNSATPFEFRHILSTLITDTTNRIRLRNDPPPASTTPISTFAPVQIFSTASTHRLAPRQSTFFAVPASYAGLTGSPSPGSVVGIVLGSILGFFLLLWLFWTLSKNTGGGYYEGDVESEVVVATRHSHSSPQRSRKTKSRRAKPEMREERSSPSRSPRRQRTERVIVAETRRTERSQVPPPPRPREESRVRERESVVVEERREQRREERVDGDDVVEVIEAHSVVSEEQPPRRKRSTRNSGFRTVDPTAYAGGNYPQRDIYDRRGSRR